MHLYNHIKMIPSGLLLFFLSCNTAPAAAPSTAVETGRDFIRATLNGDFPGAEKLLLNDPRNTELFISYKSFYDRLPAEKKAGYKNASYNINTFRDLNDSVSLINYSNSYMKQPMNIKLVRRDKTWKVDFKFTSEDSAAN